MYIFFKTPDSDKSTNKLCGNNFALANKLKSKGIAMYKFGKTKSENTRSKNQNNVVADDIEYDFKLEVQDSTFVESVVKRCLRKCAYRPQKEVYLISPKFLKSVIIRANTLSNYENNYEQLFSNLDLNYLKLLEGIVE